MTDKRKIKFCPLIRGKCKMEKCVAYVNKDRFDILNEESDKQCSFFENRSVIKKGNSK